MAKNVAKTSERIDIGALVMDYPGRFDADEIPSEPVRLNLNAACRALDGASALAKILYSNAIEREAHGAEAVALDTTTMYGLFEALLYLTANGSENAQAVGEALFKETKRAKAAGGAK